MASIDQSWRNLCDARTSSDGNFYCSGSPNSKLDRRDFIIEPHSTWADIDDQSHWSGFPGNNLALPAFSMLIRRSSRRIFAPDPRSCEQQILTNDRDHWPQDKIALGARSCSIPLFTGASVRNLGSLGWCSLQRFSWPGVHVHSSGCDSAYF